VPELFAHIYLLIFGKLAVGGLLSLAIPPFAEMERGFYKSSAAVYLVCGIFMAVGDASLMNSDAAFRPHAVEVLAWSAFCLTFSAYLISLYVEVPLVRARSFTISIVLGLFALTVAGFRLAPADAAGPAGLIAATWIVAGAAVTGAATSGMLLGHWYLIDTGLDLAPLNRMTAFYRTCLRWEVGLIAVGVIVAMLWPGQPWQTGFAELGTGLNLWLVIGRIFAWGLAFMLGSLIRRTLDIPHTMAATGLFYIAALVVAVGEIVSHYLLFRTGLTL
jgi:hypothetical protein